jgi:hypothetical protein
MNLKYDKLLNTNVNISIVINIIVDSII